MTRPIVWALGTLATAALSATAAGDRLAARFGKAEPCPAEASASTAAGRSLAVSADLRGHFVVHPALNGQRVRMLVDTGASLVTLP
jgi:aspartyl protease family protein